MPPAKPAEVPKQVVPAPRPPAEQKKDFGLTEDEERELAELMDEDD